jgi:hypothetical protein
MSKKSPSRDTERNGIKGDHPAVPQTSQPPAGTGEDDLEAWDAADLESLNLSADPWGDDESLRQEMEQLAAVNEDLIATLGVQPGADEAPAPPSGAEIELLQAENQELRQQISQLEQASREGAADWEERQKEYETLLEEKSEVIRALHQKLHELTEKEGLVAAEQAGEEQGRSVQEQEVVDLSDQLERERRQLEEDEEALMHQMREMEMAMSRERAELARQRNELQRLHSEIRHELEQAARDASLRERLAPLQRRHQEIGGTRPTRATPLPESRAEVRPTHTPGAAAGQPRKGSGLLRRLFGSGG